MRLSSLEAVRAMVTPREAISTVTFIDNYCAIYQDVFADVRSFEAFKFLHLGMISEIPRKSLPAIARAVGLQNDQVLHHCLTESPWSITAMRSPAIKPDFTAVERSKHHADH